MDYVKLGNSDLRVSSRDGNYTPKVSCKLQAFSN